MLAALNRLDRSLDAFETELHALSNQVQLMRQEIAALSDEMSGRGQAMEGRFDSAFDRLEKLIVTGNAELLAAIESRALVSAPVVSAGASTGDKR